MPVVQVPADDLPPRSKRVIHLELDLEAVGAARLSGELVEDGRLRGHLGHRFSPFPAGRLEADSCPAP